MQSTGGAFEEIARIVHSQSELSESLNTRVGVIRSATTQIQDATKSAGEAAEQLADKAHGLATLVSRFKLDKR